MRLEAAGRTLLLFLSALSGDRAFSAPTVSSAPTSWSDGGGIVITGTGFGAKPTPAPVLFDPVNYTGLSDGAVIPKGGSNPWPENGYFGGLVRYNTSDPQRTGSGAQYKSTNQTEGWLGGLSWPKTGKTYVSWWFKPDRAYTGGSHSSKVLRMSDSDDMVNRTFSWTQMHNYAVPGGQTYWQGAVAPANQWTFFEAWFDAPAGRWTLRTNGVPVTNNVPYSNISFNMLWKIGWDSGGESPIAITFWMDDIYVDSSFARVMLGNAPTYAASTRFEMQIPTSWADGSISLKANRGAIAGGTDVYLYVIDSSGAVSNNGSGVKVTFGPAGTQPLPPREVTAT